MRQTNFGRCENKTVTPSADTWPGHNYMAYSARVDCPGAASGLESNPTKKGPKTAWAKLAEAAGKTACSVCRFADMSPLEVLNEQRDRALVETEILREELAQKTLLDEIAAGVAATQNGEPQAPETNIPLPEPDLSAT